MFVLDIIYIVYVRSFVQIQQRTVLILPQNSMFICSIKIPSTCVLFSVIHWGMKNTLLPIDEIDPKILSLHIKVAVCV